MTEAGVISSTTKFTGTSLSRAVAWEAVRGNPSRIKDAEEDIEGGGAVDEEVDNCAEVCGDVSDGGSQPLDDNSEEMRFRIIESGTRLPDCIATSAWTPIEYLLAISLRIDQITTGVNQCDLPSGVLRRTFSRKRSPELMEAN